MVLLAFCQLDKPIIKTNSKGRKRMKIDEAKQLVDEMKEYIKIYENYHPENMKEEAIKLYAEVENVNSVAKILNEKGYRKEGKLVAGKRAQVKIESNDVTEILSTEINDGDQLHPIVKKALNRNRRGKGIVV